MVANTPTSGLGSTRDKPDEKYCAEIFKVLRAHGIETFFYIGGNDSSDTAKILHDQARAADYPLVCVHIPKTIDNDLVINDHTPGFPSAARFVALAFAGANLDNRALPGVYVAVVMGRHAGFLTAASALGRKYDDDGPHLIYVPERVFSLDQFVRDVREVYNKYGRCIVAVSEGIHDETGQPIATKLAKNVEKDAHGNVQLSGTGALADLLTDHIKTNTNIKRVRGDTFGYLQRSFLGCVSDVDSREAREVGEKAVQYAHFGDADGNHSGSVTIHRTGFYSVDYQLTPLRGHRGENKGDAGRVPRRQWPRCHRQVSLVPAPAVGIRYAGDLTAAAQQGAENSEYGVGIRAWRPTRSSRNAQRRSPSSFASASLHRTR